MIVVIVCVHVCYGHTWRSEDNSMVAILSSHLCAYICIHVIYVYIYEY